MTRKAKKNATTGKKVEPVPSALEKQQLETTIIQNKFASRTAEVQIEYLLESANESTNAARTAWLWFLGFAAYLLITIASTGHDDLLLNRPVKLPIVDVDLPLFSFFGYSPILLFLVHLGLLTQHAITARKLHELDSALTSALLNDEISQTYVAEVRSRLSHYAFCQVLIGHYRKYGFLAFLMRMMIWISLIIIPIFTFLAFQICFLPYHDMGQWPDEGLPSIGLTWQHRVWLILDLLLVWAIWPITKWHSTSWRQAIKIYRPAFFIVNTGLAGLIVLFSLFVATIPGEGIDNFTSQAPAPLSLRRGDRQVFAPTAWLFEGKLDKTTLTLKSPFSRSLVVAIKDFVDDDNKWDKGEWSFELRGRDLRYGQFSRIDLSYADFAYADLTDASFFRARLNNANLAFATINATNFERAELRGAVFIQVDGGKKPANFFRAIIDEGDFRGARLPRSKFANASLIKTDFQPYQNDGGIFITELKGAIFHRAKLDGTLFRGVNLDGATFTQATGKSIVFSRYETKRRKLISTNLVSANFRGATLSETDFVGAVLIDGKFQSYELQPDLSVGTNLEGAQFSFANLRGANFSDASLQGAHFQSSSLEGAIFNGATLNGAHLLSAELQGSSLRNATIQGANLTLANLQGADLSRAQFQGTILISTKLWQAEHPGGPDLRQLTDLGGIDISPLDKIGRAGVIRKLGDGLAVEFTRNVVKPRLKRLLLEPPPRWKDKGRWMSISTTSRAALPLKKIGKYLASLICSDERGHITKGINHQLIDFYRDPLVWAALAKELQGTTDEKCFGRKFANLKEFAAWGNSGDMNSSNK